ncbi:MAG TPA: class I SAM-dependent methyltransferase [Ktedonobacteraceae bacterium]|nr:class I SAM-dependent methyltransferase [Ktedonobacteraceae bacterium]
MIPHEERTDPSYDDIRFEQVIVEEMDEVLPAPLLAASDLSHARAALEIGCGAGTWLRAVARLYPDLQCIGIDQDERLVKVANALAQRDHLPQVAFLAQELNDLSPTLFPQGSFDLIHLSLLGRYILTVDYSALAQMSAGLCRPGGIVCWTEAELPITNSSAFERLAVLVLEALQRAGQSFIPESMWEWADLVAAHSGKVGVDRASYQRRHLGITPMLGRWLRNAGCGAPREKPLYSIWGIDEHVIHEAAYAIEVSAGQPAHEGFVALARRFARHVKPFLLRTEVIEEREHAVLCDQLDTELLSQEFCGMAFLLRAWAPRL